MTEREEELIKDFIKRAEQNEQIVMQPKVIGAIVSMIYDIWKRLYVR